MDLRPALVNESHLSLLAEQRRYNVLGNNAYCYNIGRTLSVILLT